MTRVEELQRIVMSLSGEDRRRISARGSQGNCRAKSACGGQAYCDSVGAGIIDLAQSIKLRMFGKGVFL